MFQFSHFSLQADFNMLAVLSNYILLISSVQVPDKGK